MKPRPIRFTLKYEYSQYTNVSGQELMPVSLATWESEKRRIVV
jgi:hypothetical protein